MIPVTLRMLGPPDSAMYFSIALKNDSSIWNDPSWIKSRSNFDLSSRWIAYANLAIANSKVTEMYFWLPYSAIWLAISCSLIKYS